MARLVDKSSSYAFAPELDFFRCPDTLTGVKKVHKRELMMQNALNSTGPYCFRSFREKTHLNLSTLTVKVELQVVNEDGTRLAAGANVALDNYAEAIIWKQVTLGVNGLEIANTGNTHAHRAYFEAAACMTADYRRDVLSVAGWVDDSGDFENKSNPAYLARKKMVAESKSLFLQGPLHVDFCNQEKLMPSMIGLVCAVIRFVNINYLQICQ
jgi:hypothetical protein